MAQAAPCAARRPRVHGVSSALLHICMVLIQMAGQPARAVGLHNGAASKHVAIEVFEPGSDTAYIADGEPYGDLLPDVYNAAGLDASGVESIIPTVRGTRKLLHGCHGSSSRCAASSLVTN